MPWDEKRGCATQDEKAAIVKSLREKGHQLKYLLEALGMAKSTHYFIINKTDAVTLRNAELMAAIRKLMNKTKVDMEFAGFIENS